MDKIVWFNIIVGSPLPGHTVCPEDSKHQQPDIKAFIPFNPQKKLFNTSLTFCNLKHILQYFVQAINIFFIVILSVESA